MDNYDHIPKDKWGYIDTSTWEAGELADLVVDLQDTIIELQKKYDTIRDQWDEFLDRQTDELKTDLH